ncbi:MFS transporter [Rugamonas sp.]|uniref:MFS transporter n=1 Tax=Rugamonas sp. TaxID=1926287 RepID=UPI0025ED37B3|nr:MFS transporter [Rugamonas sp.]
MSAVLESPVLPDAAAAPAPATSWSGVLAIALGAFTVVFAELLPVGLLSGISRDLHVLEGTAGMMVSITALLAFVAAPGTALAVGSMDRRRVLIGLTILTIISSVLSALAPSFAVLFGARILLGIALGGFWAVAVPAAARLVPADKAHVSSTIVMSGISIAAVLAVPAGTLIAAYFSWRVAFVAATIIPLIVLLTQWRYLPNIVMDDHVTVADLGRVLKSPRNAAALLTLLFAVGGQYAGYTFVTPYLAQVTGVDTNVLSSLLLAYGLFSIAGNFIGGALAARSRHGTVLGNMIVFLISLLGLTIFGGNFALATVSLMVWAVVWGIVPVSLQLWIFGGATRDKPEAVGAVLVGVLQLAISLGSFAGALAVNGAGVHSAMALGAAIVAAGILMVLIVGNIDRRNG